ncbi:hypothetical protein IQ268_12980 [Oculatella sp. LEGE 06141]|uniref:hypothetical protein n=1 Tax=Oculatella sp. LEGE 06141 TaxID=1828648 RepID=UPI00187E2135|nr:hypothetical protein [Oculatella sp. LEGE 06141]MBE9179477.1 hypothetical protein [Oculatella sp. LEGE 06141]
MQTQVNLPEATIEQIVNRIFSSRRITRADQERFMSALLSKKSISEPEKKQIDRVFEALRNGLLRVVD